MGTPLGHLDFVKAQLRAKAEEHRILLNRVEAMTDLQCAWQTLFLLRHKGELLPPHHPARGVKRIRSSPRHRHQQGVQQFVGHPRRPGHFQPCKPSVQVGRRGLRNAVRGARHMIRKRWRWGASYGSSCAKPRKPRRIGFRCSGVGRSGNGASSRFRSSSRPIPQFEQKRMATESFRHCGECFLGPVGLAHSRATRASPPPFPAGTDGRPPFHQFASFC